MRFFLPILLCLAAAVAAARAQEQESGLLKRIDANWRRGMQAMDAKAKPDQALSSEMGKKSFNSRAFDAEKFSTAAYGGVKSTSIKPYATRSFFGVKNPWFGREVYDTVSSSFARRGDRDAQKNYRADAFAVKTFGKAGQEDRRDRDVALPSPAQPRPFLVTGKTQSGLDRFTQNLQKDLTIDDVRDLLNKGKGE